MRAVNLVPVDRRQAASGAATTEPAQIVLVVGLVVALLIAGGWAVLRHQTGQARTEAAAAAQRSAVANQRATALQPAVALQTERQARQQAVDKLAEERIDWGRVYARVAGVVPQRVRLTKVDASSTGAGGETAAPTGTAAAPSGAGGSPGLAVEACAGSQRLVARTLDGLRSLPDVQSVSLTSSTRGASGDGGGTACAGVAMVASVSLVGKTGAQPISPTTSDAGAGAGPSPAQGGATDGTGGTTTEAPATGGSAAASAPSGQGAPQ